MTETWIASDHHFGHRNIVTFVNSKLEIIRKFDSIEAHDEYIIKKHNEVVKPEDKVYLLGDVAISKKAIRTCGRLNGRKTLILGNHDIFNTDEYTPYFDNVRACRVLNLPHSIGSGNVILSHIPIHEKCLGRFRLNVHGHLHANSIDEENPRYMNVSMEALQDYTPINFHQIINMIERRSL